MKDNEKILENFKDKVGTLLEGLNSFAPVVLEMKSLAEKKLTEKEATIVKEFEEKGKGLDMEGLKKLKKEYLEKLNNHGV
jgi:uncharacterized protein Yka (UPF0111/DUF47 family)